MTIKQNHDPPPDESELDGFTVEGWELFLEIERHRVLAKVKP